MPPPLSAVQLLWLNLVTNGLQDVALAFEKGERVKTGQVLCQIKLNDRGARLQEAKALSAQRQKEYEVAKKLFEDGFRSKTQMAQAEAALQAARAAEDTQAIQLANTKIRAPFDGVTDDRYVNVGDYMRPGDKCALLIAPGMWVKAPPSIW
ncbi:MAG: cation transporting ATPase C-terminal domain-containing protein [Alphaproteobacteria bacterium]|nr:cation transporting ATPase C-terminal domain-containing protein [Alphaproteobacteria bacterium]